MVADSTIDRIADEYFDDLCRLDPVRATHFGVTTYNHLWPDYSPIGLAGLRTLTTDTQRRLTEATREGAFVPRDQATAIILGEELASFRALDSAGLLLGQLNCIESPVQAVINTFDLMPVDTSQDRAAFIARLTGVPTCIDTYIAGLEARRDDGRVPFPTLQVDNCIHQANKALATIEHNVHRLHNAAERDHDTAATHEHTHSAVQAAAAGYAKLTRYLRQIIRPISTDDNACGIDAYRLLSRQFLGTSVDLMETYQWGQRELARIIDEQHTLAKKILADRAIPTTSSAGEESSQDAVIRLACSALDDDPRLTIEGTDALAEWMQKVSDHALKELAPQHFDIPPRLTALECKIAPSGTGGIYYTVPSEDGSRPGTMWWSVPESATTFHTWQELTTVFHEGVPGHHLQLGQAMISSDLNRYRKLGTFCSGHGEGWALYAEKLAYDMGWLSTDGDRMGLLDSQRLRAARVVLDIGYHCRFPAPDDLGGGSWTYEKAWQFLRSQVAMDDAILTFELHRYLGWPGQAPSYSIGQRLWLQLRDDYLAAHPDRDLRQFHSEALALGGMGLDALAECLNIDGSQIDQ